MARPTTLTGIQPIRQIDTVAARTTIRRSWTATSMSVTQAIEPVWNCIEVVRFLRLHPKAVVTEALKLVYRKDKDFQTWLSGHTQKPPNQARKESLSNWN